MIGLARRRTLAQSKFMGHCSDCNCWIRRVLMPPPTMRTRSAGHFDRDMSSKSSRRPSISRPEINFPVTLSTGPTRIALHSGHLSLQDPRSALSISGSTRDPLSTRLPPPTPSPLVSQPDYWLDELVKNVQTEHESLRSKVRETKSSQGDN